MEIKATADHEIVVYSTDHCSQCRDTIRMFERAGITPIKVGLDDTNKHVVETARAALEASGSSARLSAPIVYIDGQFAWSGMDTKKIVETIELVQAATRQNANSSNHSLVSVNS